MIDGYTTRPTIRTLSGRYHERARRQWSAHELQLRAQLGEATIDAYDGTVKLYKYDPNDPILIAYASAFPSCLHRCRRCRPTSSSTFAIHVDLLRVQTAMWSRYHVDEANAFHDGLRWWSIAQEPGREVPKPNNRQHADASATPPTKSQPQVSPYYVR